jgi:hypothetical protein
MSKCVERFYAKVENKSSGNGTENLRKMSKTVFGFQRALSALPRRTRALRVESGKLGKRRLLRSDDFVRLFDGFNFALDDRRIFYSFLKTNVASRPFNHSKIA